MPVVIQRVPTKTDGNPPRTVNVDGEIYLPFAVTPSYRVDVEKNSVIATGEWRVTHLATQKSVVRLSTKDEAREAARFLRQHYSLEFAGTTEPEVQAKVPLAVKQWCRLCTRRAKLLPYGHLAKERLE